eukprot:3039872-Rhodomonas_salina.1
MQAPSHPAQRSLRRSSLQSDSAPGCSGLATLHALLVQVLAAGESERKRRHGLELRGLLEPEVADHVVCKCVQHAAPLLARHERRNLLALVEVGRAVELAAREAALRKAPQRVRVLRHRVVELLRRNAHKRALVPVGVQDKAPAVDDPPVVEVLARGARRVELEAVLAQREEDVEGPGLVEASLVQELQLPRQHPVLRVPHRHVAPPEPRGQLLLVHTCKRSSKLC